MTLSRRAFLKIAGVSLAVFGAGSTRAGEGRDPSLVVGAGLKPAPAPGLAGKRWAMAVEISKCADGCKDCIDACHRAHNVPDFGNPKDEIKWIWSEPFRDVFPEQEHTYLQEGLKKSPVVVLCNHCENPPCVRVCPTKATFKRKEGGIVAMDYHRCIGCRFCVAACPYGARSMNFRDPRPFIKEVSPEFPTRTKGVVEKCNFCEERLARGLLPACTAACKEEALFFGDLENPASDVRKALKARFSIRRRPELGTGPQVYYLV